MIKLKQIIKTIEDIIDSCKTSDKIHAALDIIFNKIDVDLSSKEVGKESSMQEENTNRKPVSILKFWQSAIDNDYYWLITLNKNAKGKFYVSFTDVENFRDVNTDFYEEKC